MRILITFILLFSFVNSSFAKARHITCPKKYPRIIKVPLGDAMIMEFPEKPKHALPGKQSFDFQYIGKDIGIQALRPGARANFFVYLGKSRCAFRLVSTSTGADDLVIVKYPRVKTIEVNYAK